MAQWIGWRWWRENVREERRVYRRATAFAEWYAENEARAAQEKRMKAMG